MAGHGVGKFYPKSISAGALFHFLNSLSSFRNMLIILFNCVKKCFSAVLKYSVHQQQSNPALLYLILFFFGIIKKFNFSISKTKPVNFLYFTHSFHPDHVAISNKSGGLIACRARNNYFLQPLKHRHLLPRFHAVKFGFVPDG